MKKKLWFVIVTYNCNPRKLKSLLLKLKKWHVVKIDNSQKNIGFARAFNIGAKYSLKMGADWIINISPDVYTSISALTFFVGKLTSEETLYGVFGGKYDTRRWTTILSQKQKRAKSFDYFSGELLAIPKNCFLKIGFFYEPYFLYYEDCDFCERAKKAGFSLKQIYHQGFRHEPSITLGRNSFLHNYYLCRNHLLFVQRNASIMVKLHEILRLPKTILEFILAKNSGGLKGLRDYFLRRFGPYGDFHNP